MRPRQASRGSVGGAVERPRRRRVGLGHHPVQQREQDGVLGREVEVEGRPGDAGAAGQVVDRDGARAAAPRAAARPWRGWPAPGRPRTGAPGDGRGRRPSGSARGVGHGRRLPARPVSQHPVDSFDTASIASVAAEFRGSAEPLAGSGRPVPGVRDMSHRSTWTSSSSAPACPASAPPATCRRSARTRATRSSSPAARSAAPGTSSATRASARTPTCSPSATPSGRGRSSKAIADGAAIRSYIQDTAREYGVEDKIRFHHQVLSRRLVDRGRPLDGHRPAHRHRRDGAADLLVAVGLLRLLPLRRGLPAARSRARSSSPAS